MSYIISCFYQSHKLQHFDPPKFRSANCNSCSLMKLSNLITEPQRNTLTNSPNSHFSYIIHPFTAPWQQCLLHPLKDLLYWINTLTIRFTEFHYITGVLDSTSLFVELVRQKVRNKGCPLHLLLHRLRFPGRSGQWPDQSVWRGAKEDLSKDGGCNACLRTFLYYIFFSFKFFGTTNVA